MKISECRHTAGQYLKGRRGEAFVVTAICIFAFIAFKSAAAVTAYALSSTDFLPIVDAGITLLSFIVMTPLLTGGFWWFFQTACEQDNRNLLKLYSGFKLNSRALLVYALMWSKGFFSLIPSGICFTTAYILIYGRTGLEGDIILFAVFQFLVLGIVLLGLYISSLISMVAAPFIFISSPDKSPFEVIRKSSKLMKGNKLRFIGLAAYYISAMLPIITIPFVMPSAVMSAAVFAREVMRNGDS